MRVLVAVLAALCLPGPLSARPTCPDLPVASDPAALGWDPAGLAQAADMALANRADAFLVIVDGQIVVSRGDIVTPTRLASVRKSLLGLLIGRAVEAGKLDLDAPISSFGIEDGQPPLTDTERSATVRMLMQSRSGIYLPAAAETARMKALRPARGSHMPGQFWYYNNWDFNVLGEIYQRATGKGIFTAFAEEIAGPLCLRDFSAYRDGHYGYDPAAPRFAAYNMQMSARDLARIGLALLRNGEESGKGVIPREWIAESARYVARTDFEGGLSAGYGLLWWVPVPGEEPHPLLKGAYGASGVGGQKLTVIPRAGLVIVARGRGQTAEYVGSAINQPGVWETVVSAVLAARRP